MKVKFDFLQIKIKTKKNKSLRMNKTNKQIMQEVKMIISS